jgi:hypothetical protein
VKISDPTALMLADSTVGAQDAIATDGRQTRLKCLHGGLER